MMLNILCSTHKYLHLVIISIEDSKDGVMPIHFIFCKKKKQDVNDLYFWDSLAEILLLIVYIESKMNLTLS